VLARLGDLTSDRLLARNVVVNLAGWLLPALAALVAIPRLLHVMGAERFGLLSLAWSLVGYFSLFDLGIGRALTQVLAERVGRAGEGDSPDITWTAHWLLLPLGLVCGAAVAVAAEPLAFRLLNVPPALRGETATALRLLAVSVPFMVLTSGLRAVLEAAQSFRAINALRVPLGAATFLGPLAVLPFTTKLTGAVAVLAAVRVAMFVLHAVVVLARVPSLRAPRGPSRAAARALWEIAGWMTVSSIVSPIMVSADRFVIGAALPVAAVAYYATSSEIATKLWLFTAALQPVLFPAIAATFVRAPERTAALFDRGVRVTALALLPPALACVLFAREGLTVWLGAEFARHAATVLQGLAIAVFVNTIGQAAYGVLQGAGRPDIPGKLHLIELPTYVLILWLLLARFGIVGVAFAWAARMIGDTAAQLVAVERVLPPARAAARRALALATGCAVAMTGLALIPSLAWRVAAAALAGVAVAALGWRRLLTEQERAMLRASLRVARLRQPALEPQPEPPG
jgi:O-antigen/teichoic acid export membrane protein